jgi:hypothetical protein
VKVAHFSLEGGRRGALSSACGGTLRAERNLETYDPDVLAKVMFWGSLGTLGWTHVGYPVLAAALARVRDRPVRRHEIEPTVTFVLAASTDRTDELEV